MFEFFVAVAISIVVITLIAVFLFFIKPLFLLFTGTIAILIPICAIAVFVIGLAGFTVAFIKWLVEKLF